MGSGGGQGTALTHDHLYLSYVLRSMFPVFPNFSPKSNIQSNRWFSLAGPLPTPHSSFLFPVFTFYNPLIFSYDNCIKRTTKPSYKINPTIFPELGIDHRKMTRWIDNVSSCPHFFTDHSTSSVPAHHNLIDHSTMSDPALHFLTLIPTAVTIYGSHYFKAKFLKKSLNNINLKK